MNARNQEPHGRAGQPMAHGPRGPRRRIVLGFARDQRQIRARVADLNAACEYVEPGLVGVGPIGPWQQLTQCHPAIAAKDDLGIAIRRIDLLNELPATSARR